MKKSLVLMLLLCATARAGQPVAVLSDVGGKVQHGSSAASLFDSFGSGDVLVASPGSHWTLSFVRAGRRVSGGAGHFVVTENGATGDGPLRKIAEAPQLKGLTFDQSLNWDRMGGMTRKAGDLAWNVDAVLPEPHAELTWTADARYREVEVSVENTADHNRQTRRVPASPSSLTVELIAGQRYKLGLKGLPQGDLAISRTVRVLSAEDLARLRALQSSATPTELCYEYLQLGMLEKARELAVQLQKEYPDEPNLRKLAQP